MTHAERSKRRDEIIRRIQNGENRLDLANEYGLSLATIKGMGGGKKIDIGSRTF